MIRSASVVPLPLASAPADAKKAEDEKKLQAGSAVSVLVAAENGKWDICQPKYQVWLDATSKWATTALEFERAFYAFLQNEVPLVQWPIYLRIRDTHLNDMAMCRDRAVKTQEICREMLLLGDPKDMTSTKKRTERAVHFNTMCETYALSAKPKAGKPAKGGKKE